MPEPETSHNYEHPDESTDTNVSEESDNLIEFPSDNSGIRMPTQRLPTDLGRIADDHPLQKPLKIFLIIFGIILIIYILLTLSGIFNPPAKPQSDPTSERTSFFDQHHEEGSITYNGLIIKGWFLDESREHFISSDGYRFTYVNSHDRAGSPVSGYWRKIER